MAKPKKQPHTEIQFQALLGLHSGDFPCSCVNGQEGDGKELFKNSNHS